MAKVLVLYYSSYGHMSQLADAVAEGARSAGAEVDILRVHETAPEEVAAAALFLAQGWLASGQTLFVDSGQHLCDQDRDVIYLAREKMNS